jgi:hypothetical protein
VSEKICISLYKLRPTGVVYAAACPSNARMSSCADKAVLKIMMRDNQNMKRSAQRSPSLPYRSVVTYTREIGNYACPRFRCYRKGVSRDWLAHLKTKANQYKALSDEQKSNEDPMLQLSKGNRGFHTIRIHRF